MTMISPASAIALSTVRIISTHPAGVGSGTGALFNFHLMHKGEEQKVPALVTNKHVVNNSQKIEIVITLADKDSGESLTDSLMISGAKNAVVTIPAPANFIINHPSPTIDLCAILIQPFIAGFAESYILRHYFVDESWFLNASLKSIMRPIEPIVMAGYPNGLWDATNNLPLIRSGLTASHPLLAWNGKPEFVIDAACFPGSSGSPVFLYEDGMYRTADGLTAGTRACLLGFLYEGPLVTVEGRIVQRAIPTGFQDVPVVHSMMNLGNVINAEQIEFLKPEIAKLLP
jgi:hypothetical protein